MWKRLPDLEFTIVNHQTININNVIYIIGGYKNSTSPDYEKISIYVISKESYCVRMTTNNTYSWHCKENTLMNIESSTNPRDRYGHTVVAWRQLGILFGGCSGYGYCDPDIYIFIPGKRCLEINALNDISDEGSRWINVIGIGGNIPLQRDGHSSVIHGNNMFVYGGLVKCETRHYDNKLYQLDLKTWQWSITYCGDYLEPIGRDFCNLLAHENSLYLIGGRSDNCFSGTHYIDVYDTALWKFDFKTRSWKKIHPGYGIIYGTISETGHSGLEIDNSSIEKCPLPRRSFMAAILKDEIIIFGGLYEGSDFSIHFNDIWSYDISINQWKCLPSSTTDPSQGIPVPSRKGSFTKLNDHCILLIGGVTTLNNVTSDFTKIIAKSLSYPTNARPSDFNFVAGRSSLSNSGNKSYVTMYHQSYTPFSGSIETLNELTIKSTRQVFVLQPQISLYQKALSVVVHLYSTFQLRSFHIPSKIISDIDTFRISPADNHQ